MDAFHSRQMIWQAETGFTFPLAGGFFGVTPPGRRSAAAQAQLGMGPVRGASAADVRSSCAVTMSAVLMAEEPQDEVRAMARVTGSPESSAAVWWFSGSECARYRTAGCRKRGIRSLS